MKKILLTILLALVSFTMLSQDVNKTFTPGNYVMDLGNLYTSDEELQLNKVISEYEKKTSIEIGILTVESLNGESIENYAYEQFNRIGIGKSGANNGLLIVFSKNDRESRVEVGDGMEPFVTDQVAYQSLEVIKPFFREEKYFSGTEACLTFIIKDLGNEAFANRVKWLAEKKALQAKESKIRAEKTRVVFMYIGITIAIFGTLFFIYFIDKKNRELILKIKNVENSIKEFSIDKNCFSSKIAKKSLDILMSFYNEIDLEKIKKDSKNKNVYLDNLLFKEMSLISRRSSHGMLVNSIKRDLDEMRVMSESIEYIRSLNQMSITANNEIKNFGYQYHYNDLSNNIDKLLTIASDINKSLNLDSDKSIELFKKFKSGSESLMKMCKEGVDKLATITSAKRAVNSSESTIMSYMNDIDGLKNYKLTSDLPKMEEIKSKINEFNNLKKDSKDYLMLSGVLLSLINLIRSLLSSIRRRKEEEEEEKRRKIRLEQAAVASLLAKQESDRRRREESYSSSSSYNSSSFGGFGGGRSSGGGASSGW